MGEVTVSSGDCVSSIAAVAGISAAKVWAANAALAATRDNANVLAPGDVIELPELDAKAEQQPTDQRHVFQVKTEKTVLRLRLLYATLDPRDRRDYTLTIDGGDTRQGTTDDNGMLEEEIPPNAQHVTIAIHGFHDESYFIPLGTIMPIETVKGVQQRLLNLGMEVGPVDGIWGQRSRDGMMSYQFMRGLKMTGTIDDTSRADLKATHGC